MLSFLVSYKVLKANLLVFLVFACQVKDANNVSGGARKSCSYYDEVDEILGTRAASCPPVVLESDGGEAASNVSGDDEGVFL